MSQIVLCTLNARYWHSAFGLRYLMANLGELQAETTMLEFGINDNTIELLGKILHHRPKIVGIGVYIWNVEPATKLVAELKRVSPETHVVLGGPEVSYETEQQQIADDADYVITGEGDLAFPALCRAILDGDPPAAKTQTPPLPTFEQLKLPYALYTDHDIANRVVYVEASRGCPFTCEFCLSALEIPVRMANVDLFLSEMDKLLQRGAKQFKFVDRTFNLNLRVSQQILEFFLARYTPDMFLHFEMIPDRLPTELRSIIAKFPAGALQFEIGVQTFNHAVGNRISRKQDNEKLAENFRFLREQTGVHIHADLIVGLPGETLESFGRGFDRLVALRPQEIQIGILKRLRGTPITRHDETWKMIYSPHTPYEILSTSHMAFDEIQRMRRFARYWDLVGNSGNFVDARELIWDTGSPFDKFMEFSDWLYDRERTLHGISLTRLTESVFEFLLERGHRAESVASIVWTDYIRGGRYDKPHFLRRFHLPDVPSRPAKTVPPRQARHVS